MLCRFILCYTSQRFLVQCQVIRQDEGSSPQSTVIGIKGSSVWLHWVYTYIGDGMRGGVITTTMVDHVIAFRNKSQSTAQTLARKVGQSGILMLESPVPDPFDGRVEVIAANSTLVIHDLQYNDSEYAFVSSIRVTIDSGGGNILNTFNIKPEFTITVHGIPVFIVQPQKTLEINESSNVHLRIEMDGYPQPSASFRWPHLTDSSATNVPSVQLYPFVYSSTYILNTIDASYCGRILQTTLRNDIGSSSVRNTAVTVLPNLRQPLNVTAQKRPYKSCVKVKWNKIESGACSIKYHIALKNGTGYELYSEYFHNTDESEICNLTAFTTITDVQFTVSFRTAQRSTTIKVSPDTTVLKTVPTQQCPKTVTVTVYTTIPATVKVAVTTTVKMTVNMSENAIGSTTVPTIVNTKANMILPTTVARIELTTVTTTAHTKASTTVPTTAAMTRNRTVNRTVSKPFSTHADTKASTLGNTTIYTIGSTTTAITGNETKNTAVPTTVPMRTPTTVVVAVNKTLTTAVDVTKHMTGHRTLCTTVETKVNSTVSNTVIATAVTKASTRSKTNANAIGNAFAYTTANQTVAMTANVTVSLIAPTIVHTAVPATVPMTAPTTSTTVVYAVNKTVSTTSSTQANTTANITASTIRNKTVYETGSTTVATKVNVSVNRTANKTLPHPSKRLRTAEGKDLILVVCITFGGLMLLMLIVLMLIVFSKKLKRSRRYRTSSNQKSRSSNSKDRQQKVEMVGLNQVKKLQPTI